MNNVSQTLWWILGSFAVAVLAIVNWLRMHPGSVEEGHVAVAPTSGVPMSFDVWEMWDWNWVSPGLGCMDFAALEEFPGDCGGVASGQIHRFQQSHTGLTVWFAEGLLPHEVHREAGWEMHPWMQGHWIAQPEAWAAWVSEPDRLLTGSAHLMTPFWHPRGGGWTRLTSDSLGVLSDWQACGETEHLQTRWWVEGSDEDRMNIDRKRWGDRSFGGASPAPPAQARASGMQNTAPPEAPAVLSEVPENPWVELGQARNHRSGKTMRITWNASENKVVSRQGDETIWSLLLQAGEVPLGKVHEVDLYRNRKFQVVVGTNQAVHCIDVLGREVRGYPLRPNHPISALAVVDYDGQRAYRLLIGTSDGRLLNFREEGEQTPGWRHKSQTSAIAHIAHVRVGVKDYLYTGTVDGSVRLLKRSGEDRYTTSVKVPSTSPPAFRVGSSIENTTVLFVDGAGWVREQRLGNAEDVGLSRMVKGVAVAVSDINRDGIPEVIVEQADGGHSVWNARNEQLE